MSSRRRVAVGLGLLTVVAVSSALAATPVAYWKPAAMAAKIKGPIPQIPTDNASAPSNISATVCQGLGTAHSGKYATFKCKATWQQGRSNIWARALPGGKFCASSTGLAACPATPAVAGDPRVCTSGGVPPTADPNRCALADNELAVFRAMKIRLGDPNWKPGNLSCNGSNLVWNCNFTTLNVFGVYYKTVTHFVYAQNAWTASIAENTVGADTSVTCTVAPAPAPVSGAISRWAAGPDPVCA